MKIASVADVKPRFSAFLKDGEAGTVVVTRNGPPVVVIFGAQGRGRNRAASVGGITVLVCDPRTLPPTVSRCAVARRRGILAAMRAEHAVQEAAQTKAE